MSKQKYLIEKLELVKIEIDSNNIPPPLIGKYYLHKVNGRNCFHKITSMIIITINGKKFLDIFSSIEGAVNYRRFPTKNLPPFYEKRYTDKGVMFNVF